MVLTNGWVFLGITACISAGVFLNGLRFARMTQNPFVGRKLFGQSIEGAELSVKQLNRIGKMQMAGAPIFLLFIGAMSFGLFGPVEGIETIKLN